MTSITLQMASRGIITIPKALREPYDLKKGDTFTLIDLGGVFILRPKASEIDAIADQISRQWEKDGESLESILQALREERAAREP